MPQYAAAMAGQAQDDVDKLRKEVAELKDRVDALESALRGEISKNSSMIGKWDRK